MKYFGSRVPPKLTITLSPKPQNFGCLLHFETLFPENLKLFAYDVNVFYKTSKYNYHIQILFDLICKKTDIVHELNCIINIMKCQKQFIKFCVSCQIFIGIALLSQKILKVKDVPNSHMRQFIMNRPRNK